MPAGISVAVHLLPAGCVGALAVALGLPAEVEEVAEAVAGAEVLDVSELEGLVEPDVVVLPADVVEPCDPVGGGFVLAAHEHPAVSAAVPIAQVAAKTEIRFMGPNLPG
ncbi:MAG: hypothetical protein HOV83_32430 [Catenulispora sp.]|nr:hypothetical protein [Catenulispora sp.]